MDFWVDRAFHEDVLYVEMVAAGLGIGAVFGVFGAGGSAFATPVMALLGVSGTFAVASPLPAMIPASIVGARRSLRSGKLDVRVAKLAVAGGVPGAILGALASVAVGGGRLVVASGIMLLVVGVRVLLPDPVDSARRCAARRESTGIVLAGAFAVGLLTGLLANGGGFLLVPLFIVLLGLSACEAAGTSMVAVGVLTIPTLLTHWLLGHIDWPIAIAFAIGVLPGSSVGARFAPRLSARFARRAFGTLLVIFAVWFLVRLFPEEVPHDLPPVPTRVPVAYSYLVGDETTGPPQAWAVPGHPALWAPAR